MVKTEDLRQVQQILNEPVDLTKPLNLKVWQNYDENNEQPVVIGGMAGSGTRVAVWLLQALGYYMGHVDFDDYLLGTRDCIPMGWFSSNYAMHNLLGRTTSYSEDQWTKMFNSLALALDCHLVFRNGEKNWGWKMPSMMHIVELLHHYLPNMKYIHVIRDGRDIATQWKEMISFTHQNLIEVLPIQYDDPYIKYMWLWDRLNQDAMKQMKCLKPENCMIIRFEDMVSNIDKMLETFKHFTGETELVDSSYLDRILTPKTIGRWKRDGFEADRIQSTMAGYSTLKKFKYDIYGD